tara:strand:- start:66 stop:284 length:219 start_codon:yes stop_codon:yes gene_type:complete
MFITEVGLVSVARNPGESLNFYYKKSEKIIEKITKNSHTSKHKFFTTPSQIEQIFNKSLKEACEEKIGCKYY